MITFISFPSFSDFSKKSLTNSLNSSIFFVKEFSLLPFLKVSLENNIFDKREYRPGVNSASASRRGFK